MGHHETAYPDLHGEDCGSCATLEQCWFCDGKCWRVVAWMQRDFELMLGSGVGQRLPAHVDKDDIWGRAEGREPATKMG